MLKDISVGRYYNAESPVHSLDPRVKILASFAYLIILFFFNSLYTLVLASLLLYVMIKISKVPFIYILRGIKPILFIIIFTAIINLFVTDGRVIFQVYKFKLTYEGVFKTVFVSLRLSLLIMASSLMTYTTTQLSISDGIESLLSPLKKIKFPSHELAMMMGIALRFIPTLVDESDRIIKAQMARGADFSGKGLINKAKSFLPLLVPIFINSFKRAIDLAYAMEARCYRGGEGRTRLKKLEYSSRDVKAGLIIIIALITCLVLDKFVFSSTWQIT